MDLQESLKKSQLFFRSKETLGYPFRMEQLDKLQSALEKYETEIFRALKSDLNKSPYEAFMSELGIVYGELAHAKRNLKSWMRPKGVRPSLSQIPGRGRIYHDPYGVVLIMSPWNYPLQLTLVPLIGAICAGNCVFVKPSAYSEGTSYIIKMMLEDFFDQDYIRVVEGGRQENQALLEMEFDYIFFTGSPNVGKTVMEAAAKRLTPVTLELGGKSPCIVERSADLGKTAKRILFGKTMNSGQTCVAPDYLLVERPVKDALIREMVKAYGEMFPGDEYFQKTAPSIINDSHFQRIRDLLKGQNVIFGGEILEESRQMKLALVDEPDLDTPLMTEEIFGPILPVLAWDSLDEIIERLSKSPKPLSLYLFTKNRSVEKRVMGEVSFGGGCVNDTLLHLTSSAMPFGGVGNSGMGQYHGKASFDTFSHKKNILHKSLLFDINLRYHPYKNRKRTLPRFLF
ncbi:MAG: aldehyde dehydrogenase [Anaerovoracaceae bacterium]